MSLNEHFTIRFIGGGNMASAMIGGLLSRGFARTQLSVVDPQAEVVARHRKQGLDAQTEFHPSAQPLDVLVWAVKPQSFREACDPIAPHTTAALHLSVAAGLTTDALSRWLKTDRLVRAMPNTPALIGLGQTGLYARSAATEADRQRVDQIMAAIGQSLWVEQEADLDAVTALSGSGPAYVFYFLEAMMAAAARMGLPPAAARQLAMGTFEGATALALASSDSPDVLRERVTSKGGTTFAALEHLRQHQVGEHFADALIAARDRAQAMGQELGQS